MTTHDLDQLDRRMAEVFNEGIEAAAAIFDRREVEFYLAASEWDRTQIVKGSKYCVPTNGPAIACVAAEKAAKDIRGLKKACLAAAAVLVTLGGGGKESNNHIESRDKDFFPGPY